MQSSQKVEKLDKQSNCLSESVSAFKIQKSRHTKNNILHFCFHKLCLPQIKGCGVIKIVMRNSDDILY